MVETLVNIGENAVPELIKILKDGNPDIRDSVAGALQSIGTPEALKVFNEHQESLIQMLQDPDPDIRISTIETLGQIGSQDIVSALVEVLQDQNQSVRVSAAETLGNIGKYGQRCSTCSDPRVTGQRWRRACFRGRGTG